MPPRTLPPRQQPKKQKPSAETDKQKQDEKDEPENKQDGNNDDDDDVNDNTNANDADVEDEEEEEEQEAFVDLNNNPDFEVVDDGTTNNNGASGQQDDDDDDDDEGEEEVAQVQEPEGIPIVDKTPERDDSFVQFFPPRVESRLPLHALAVHPTCPNIVVTAGEQDVAYVLRLPTQFDQIPPPTLSSTANQNQGAAAVAADVSSELSPEAQAEAAAALKGKPYSVPEKNTWDVFAILQAHKDTITQLAFAPNGKVLATAGMDGKVILWNSDPGKAPSCLHHLNDLEGEIECLLWHPSSLMVVAGSTNAQIILWNVQKGTPAQYFSGHRDVVTCLEWSNDFKKLISASSDGSVMMFNPKTGAAEVTVAKGISEDNAGISSMLVMPSANANDTTPMVLAGCVDGCMALVSLAAPKGRVIKNLPEIHDQAIESIAITGKGTTTFPLVASCSCDCKLVLWSVPELTPTATIMCSEGMTKVLWINSLVVAACTDGDVRCWESRTAAGDMKDVKPQIHLQGHRRLVLGLGVSVIKNVNGSSTKHVIVTCADDGFAKAYTITAPQ